MCVCMLVFVCLCAWQGAHRAGVEGDCGEVEAEKEQEDLSLGRLKNPKTKNFPGSWIWVDPSKRPSGRRLLPTLASYPELEA